MNQLENSTKGESDIINRLLEKLPDRAIQRTKKENTKKAYDTDGYGYMFCVNRFNEVLGNQWGYDYKILKELNGTYKSGTPYFDITVEVSIWILSPANGRICFGGHISSVYADALKGAFTNAFKKTAGMWGVGRHAYEGTLDDDASYEEEPGDKKKDKPKPEPDIEKEEKRTTPIPSGGVTKDGKVPDKGEPEKPKTGIATGATVRALLTFDDLIQKMATSKNKFELAARCKKYKEDYSKLDAEHQKFIIIERDKRILWLTKGEGIYKDEETRGIDKPKEGVK